MEVHLYKAGGVRPKRRWMDRVRGVLSKRRDCWGRCTTELY